MGQIRSFVSDEVSAEDDEEAKQDEDDDSHYPSDHGVVHPRSRRHGCGVCNVACFICESVNSIQLD